MSIMSHIDAAVSAIHGPDYVILSGAEARWISDAVCAVAALADRDDYGREQAGRALADSRLGGWTDDDIADAIAERDHAGMRAALIGAVRVLLANDPGDAAALESTWGRPTPQ